MNVLVDTSVWSLALRRRSPGQEPAVHQLRDLITESRAFVIGPVRQELLSGVRNAKQFDLLKHHLQAFPDLVLDTEDYEDAARFFNRCREVGIQGSNIDFLLCAVSHRRKMGLLTTDQDFLHFSKVLPIVLYAPR